MAEVYEWADTRAGNGTENPPDHPKEGMDKSDVNDTMRENMAAVRKWYQDQTFIDLFDSIDEEWTISRISDTVVRVAGPSDPSGDLCVDRRVKITASGGPTTVYGFVESLGDWGTGFVDVTVEIDDSGVVPVDTDQIEVMAIKLGRAVILNDGSAADELPKGSDLTDSITANMSDKSAALKDHADSFDDDPDHVPLYGQLGTVCDKDQGTDDGEVPLVSDLPTVLGDLAFLDRPGRAYAAITDDWYTTEDDLMPIPGLDNIAIPGADGSRLYEVEVLVFVGTSGTSPCTLRVGTAGNETDPVLVNMIEAPDGDLPAWLDFDRWGRVDWGGASLEGFVFLYRYIMQPAADTKVTIAVNPADIPGFRVLEGSYVLVTEILGEA